MHLRLWLAEQVAHQVDPVGLAGAPWVSYYARALGAKLGANVDLHSLPPVTGMLEIARRRGDRARGRPVGLLDRRRHRADRRHQHRRRRDDRHAQHPRPGNADRPGRRDRARFGRVRSRARRPALGGLARRPRGRARRARSHPSARRRRRAGSGRTAPPRRSSGCCPSSRSPRAASLAGVRDPRCVIDRGCRPGGAHLARSRDARRRRGVRRARSSCSCALLSIGLVEGVHPVRSRVAWQAWTTERLLDSARTILFPLYSSLFTPVWLRMLGAEVGPRRRGVHRAAHPRR